jgi:hypothetical protein
MNAVQISEVLSLKIPDFKAAKIYSVFLTLNNLVILTNVMLKTVRIMITSKMS